MNTEEVVNISSNAYSSLDNSNLSNVLNEIQDDGPAYAESKEHVAISKDTKKTTESKDNKLNDQSNNLTEELLATYKKTSVVKPKVHAVLLQLLLTLLITVVGVATLYKLDLRTSDLESAITTIDEMQNNDVVINTGITPEINKIDSKLISFKKDIDLIETNYSDSFKENKEVIEKMFEEKNNEITLIKNSSFDLERKILALTSEIELLKNKFKDNSASNNKAKLSTEKVSVIRSTAPLNGLSVMLASLSNKKMVNTITSKLNTAGLLPAVETVVINNKNIHRISVSGFADKEEALLFIRNAKNAYGTSGSKLKK